MVTVIYEQSVNDNYVQLFNTPLEQPLFAMFEK